MALNSIYAKVKNAWSCTYITSVSLHGVVLT